MDVLEASIIQNVIILQTVLHEVSPFILSLLHFIGSIITCFLHLALKARKIYFYMNVKGDRGVWGQKNMSSLF